MEETRNAHEILHEESEEIKPFWGRVRIILKLICRKWNVRMWTRVI
jgi:hypothetical protein